MYEALNVGKKITNCTVLSVKVETNLLSLVSPWLDKFCQITTKVLQEFSPKYFGSKHRVSQSSDLDVQSILEASNWQSHEIKVKNGRQDIFDLETVKKYDGRHITTPVMRDISASLKQNSSIAFLDISSQK
jgi:hypothetical protein